MKSCRFTTAALLLLSTVSLASCFRSPDMAKLSCTTGARCPSGWQCVVPAGQVTGFCAKAFDGGGPDVIVPSDAATSIDGIIPTVDVPPVDVPEIGVRVDAGATIDASQDKGAMDAGQDYPFALDVTADVALDSPLPPPDTGTDVGIDGPALKAQGLPCTLAAECQAGLTCADGVCCDRACSGCFACSVELNGTRNGACLPVPTGQKAHNTCTTSGTPCGLDGTCDGAGSCRYTPKGTACGSTCSNATLTASACDGAGACAPGTPQPCSGSLICLNATSCKSSCATSADCVTGNCTVTGTCGAQKLGNGATCSAGTECSSGNCVTSRCCTTSSCPACQDCLGSGGTCAKITGSDGQSCGTNMYCQNGACGACTPGVSCSTGNVCEDGTTSCSTGRSVCTKTGNKSSSTQCSAQSCSGSTQYNAAYCSNGACPTATTVSCSYGCSGSACQNLKPNGTVCAASSECQSGGCVWQSSVGDYVCGTCGTLNAACCMVEECRSGYYCVSQTSCQAQKNLGDACGVSKECLSGFCSMASVCVTSCGLKGDGCCAGGDCSAAGLFCVRPTGAGWYCLPCGVRGSQCCTAPAQACESGLTCNTDIGGFCE